jgi:voltage-gated potassium channel
VTSSRETAGAKSADVQTDMVEEKTYVVDTNYVVFTFAVALITVVNSVLILAFRWAIELQGAIVIINRSLSVFLLADAFWRLNKMPNRSNYLFKHSGWLVFVGSLPFPFFGIARLIHSSLSMRRLRHGDFREARNVIITKRAQSTLLFVVLTAIIVYEVAVLLVLAVEVQHPGSNIITANDALWWGYVTIATVGYGDYFPVTSPGRIVGVALMTVGVGLFSGITSFMADWFRRPRDAGISEANGDDVAPQSNDTLQMLATMRAALEEQEEAHQETISRMREQLDRLEKSVRLNATAKPASQEQPKS